MVLILKISLLLGRKLGFAARNVHGYHAGVLGSLWLIYVYAENYDGCGRRGHLLVYCMYKFAVGHTFVVDFDGITG